MQNLISVTPTQIWTLTYKEHEPPNHWWGEPRQKEHRRCNAVGSGSHQCPITGGGGVGPWVRWCSRTKASHCGSHTHRPVNRRAHRSHAVSRSPAAVGPWPRRGWRGGGYPNHPPPRPLGGVLPGRHILTYPSSTLSVLPLCLGWKARGQHH